MATQFRYFFDSGNSAVSTEMNSPAGTLESQ